MEKQMIVEERNERRRTDAFDKNKQALVEVVFELRKTNGMTQTDDRATFSFGFGTAPDWKVGDVVTLREDR